MPVLDDDFDNPRVRTASRDVWSANVPMPPSSDNLRQDIRRLLNEFEHLGPAFIRGQLDDEGRHRAVPLGVIVGVRNGL